MNRYNTYFDVQRRSPIRDARGERSTDYLHVRYLWCESPRDGNVRIQEFGGVVMSEGTLRSRTPYVTDIMIDDKLVDSAGNAWYVRSALDADGRRIETQLVLSQQPSKLV